MACAPDEEVNALIRRVNATRYAPAGMLCGANCQNALTWYQWDAQMSGAFYELLKHLENTLSLAMSSRLAVGFGQVDWWNAPGIDLHHAAEQMALEAADRVRAGGRTLKPGEVVYEMTFGFWVSLLSRGNDYENRLWRPHLRHAFPEYRGNRERLRQDLDYLRTLRNQIMHHRPIGSRHLAADCASIYRVIGYVSPDLTKWLPAMDRVPMLLAARPGPCPQRNDGSRR
jgi:hypothetical protein